VVSGAAHTWYSFDRKTGLPSGICLMSGMEFKNGALDPHIAMPYMPGAAHLEKLLNTIFCVPRFFTGAAGFLFYR